MPTRHVATVILPKLAAQISTVDFLPDFLPTFSPSFIKTRLKTVENGVFGPEVDGKTPSKPVKKSQDKLAEYFGCG
jgi:hypothetical protein